MYNLGLDIGYSNLKLGADNGAGVIERKCLPAGSGPSVQRSISLMGPAAEGIDVMVDGVLYTTCVNQSEFPSMVRQLTSEYSRTPAYKALFLAALKMQDIDVIDNLVTGLPVEIYRNDSERAWIVKLMQGAHDVGGRTVLVNNVEVLPQPLGSFMAAIDQQDGDIESFASETVLVVDPGFFSFDFTLLSGGRPVKEVCGNSCYAMSLVLEDIQKQIRADLVRIFAYYEHRFSPIVNT